MHVAPRLVVLVRHGKAESGVEGADHARRLTARGAADATETGRWLAARLTAVDVAWVSTAVRARATWTAVAPSLPPAGEVLMERELYHSGGREVLDRVSERAVPVLVIVGHNPTLEQALFGLTGEMHGMRPGSAAIVEVVTAEDGVVGGRLRDLHQPGTR